VHRSIFAIAALLVAAPAAALELPARKAGLWELKLTIEGRATPHVMQQCVDAATDRMMNSSVSGLAQSNCPKQDMRRSGSTIVIDSICNVGGQTTTSRVEVTGDFEKAYTMKVASTTEGAPPRATAGAAPGRPAIPQGQSNLAIEATWLGACKAGQKPGDMVLPGGITMNVKNLQGMMPGLMAPR
jgi:hypothetical protein